MNWSYVAGLFDGEGCPALVFGYNKGRYPFVYPSMVFYGSKMLTTKLTNFLRKHRIRAKSYPHTGCYRTVVTGWQNCEILCCKIQGKVIEKKSVIKLLLQAIELHHDIVSNKGKLTSKANLRAFNKIRYELHEHAKKGRPLKTYKFEI